MLLAFDVGNSNIVFGVYDNINGNEELKGLWRLTTDKNKTADELGIMVKSMLNHDNFQVDQIDDIIISSVVPQMMYALSHMGKKYFGKDSIIVGPGTKTGLNIRYDDPKQVGADRIVNAVAAFKKYGGPIIIVDFGTATTFCAVTAACEYLGGAILPGIKISSDALYEKTAKLPRVELIKPDYVIGKATVESIQSGILYGNAGAVEYIGERIKKEIFADHNKRVLKKHPELKEMESHSQIKVVATGGLSYMIAEETKSIDVVDRYLTLDGLKIIYDRIKK